MFSSNMCKTFRFSGNLLYRHDVRMTDPMQEHYYSNGQIYTDMIIYTHITEDESYCSV